MPKPPTYQRDQILDAAMRAVHAHWRSATVAHVTALLGAPSGSIYHRFRSRDALFASAWIRSVKRFHAQFSTIDEFDDPVLAITETALLIPRFCREHPLDARMLTVYRYADLVADPPTGLRDALHDLNAPVRRLLSRLAIACYGNAGSRALELVSLACREIPMGIVRPRIGEHIPVWLDEPVRAASAAVARLAPAEAG